MNDTLSFIPNVLNKQKLDQVILREFTDSLSVGWIWNLLNTTDLGIVNRQLISTMVKQHLQVCS